MGNNNSGLERVVGYQMPGDLRHQPTRHPSFVVPLKKDAQESEPAPIRVREDVVCMEVAEFHKNVSQFDMKLPVFQLIEAVAKQSQSLHGSDRVACAFQRQMNVQVADQNLRLIHQRCPLSGRQAGCPAEEFAELGNRANYAQPVLPSETRGFKEAPL